MNRVFVCSPLSDPFAGTVSKHIKFANDMCKHLMVFEHVAAFAPHAFYTSFLNDDCDDQRTIGINAGIEFLSTCDKMVVYSPTEGPTEGMLKEIQYCINNDIEIEYRPQVYDVWMNSLQ